jgi:hypothetical protein
MRSALTPMSIVALFVLGSTGTPAWAAGPEELDEAERFVAEQRYGRALEALNKTLAREGLDLSSHLRALELSGIANAGLNRGSEAVDRFKKLLVIEPAFKCPSCTPRAMTAFYEAAEWVSSNGFLQLSTPAIASKPGLIERVTVKLESDPLKLVRSVRFHHRAPGDEWSETFAPLEEGAAAVEVYLPSLQYWVELLGERGEVLKRVGTANVPLAVEAPRVVAPAPTFAAKPSARLAESAPPSGPRYRPLAYAAFGASAASLGAGVYFGARARSTRDRLANVSRDEAGRVVGITQAEANQLSDSVVLDARTANYLFASGAALAVTGGLVFWLGGRLAVTPAPAGVTLAGELP